MKHLSPHYKLKGKRHNMTHTIGVTNGNPLQYSCMENPRDGGAWWAAFYGVAQSRTRLNRLSSSRGFPGGSAVKNPPAMQETQVQSLGWEDPLEQEMATYSSTLAWKMDGGAW